MAQEKNVNFFSDGIKISATLFIPDDYKEGEKRAGIIQCPGWTADKEMFCPEHARDYCRAGYVCLFFDYRGYGASGGPHGQELKPLERVEDTKNAVTYLALQPEVNKDKIGIVGHCFGGGVAIYAAATDERIKCIATMEVIGNGERWLRSTRRNYEWVEFLERLEKDRDRRVLTGISEHIPTFEIAPPDPANEKQAPSYKAKYKYSAATPSLASAQAIIDFKPEELADRLSPRPLLIFCAARNLWTDSINQTKSLYEKAKEPKKLVILPDCAHFGMEDGPEREAVIKEIIEWLRCYLPPL